MAVSQVPAPLEDAIQQASQAYDVPGDLLEGIWRVESGSHFPNPYVNSSGYGGLFGTHDAFGSTQEQADTAADILAKALRSTGGNIAQALSIYNSGKPSGGYTQVPGETTFGTITPPPDPGGVAGAGLNPGTNTQQSSGISGAAGSQTGSSSDVGLSIPFISGWASDAEKLLLRGLEIAGGVALVMLGLAGIYLALVKGRSDVGALATALRSNVPSPPSPSSGGGTSAASSSRGPISEQPRRVQRRAGFEPASAKRDAREAKARRKALERPAPGDTVPF